MNKKQADLQAMLERARLARESGIDAEAAPEPKAAAAPPPEKKQAVTRDAIFGAMRQASGLSANSRTAFGGKGGQSGVAKPAARPASSVAVAPSVSSAGVPAVVKGPSVEEQYAAFDLMVSGSRAGRDARALSSELLKQGTVRPRRLHVCIFVRACAGLGLIRY